MKFRKLGSGVMASIMAVSTCIVMPVTAQAAAVSIGEVNGALVPQNTIVGAKTARIYLDITVNTSGDERIEIYAQSPSMSYAQTWVGSAGSSWSTVMAGSVGETTIVDVDISKMDFATDSWYQVGMKTPDDTIICAELNKVEFLDENEDILATYDAKAASITDKNFIFSTLKNDEMKVGDSFTITYDDTNTPEGCKFEAKFAYNATTKSIYKMENGEYVVDEWGNKVVECTDYHTVVKDDGTVDNTLEDVLGVKAEIKDNVITFTATEATECQFRVNIEYTALGDWTDRAYPYFGDVSYMVIPEEAPAPTAYKLTAAESELYTVEFADGITGAVAGAEIVATVTAADGYLVKGVEATGVTLDEVISGENSVETITFIMPEADVEVSATAEKEPAAPAAPVITAFAADSKVTLTWDAVDGATSYLLYTYEDGKYTPLQRTTGTVYTVRNLTNGKEYGFLLRAYANGKWSSFTTDNVVYATPSAPATSPKPTVYPADSKVTLTWDAIDGATNYMLYSYTDGEYAPIGRTTGTVYTVRDLTNGTEYGFLLRALVNGKWTAFTANDVVYATPANTAPKPKTFSGDSKVTLTWDAIDGATNYMLYSYTDGKYAPIGRTTGTVYTVRNLTNDTEYGFLLRALVNGKWSAFTVNDVVYETPKA